MILFPEGVVSVPGEDVYESGSIRRMLIQSCERNGFKDMNFTYRPIIMFPRLEVGWGTEKPSTPQQREQYVHQLNIANRALNLAGVAHLDLRPANIMWRDTGRDRDMNTNGEEEFSCVELKVIDFEDAVIFGHFIDLLIKQARLIKQKKLL